MKTVKLIVLGMITLFLFCFTAQAFEVPGHSVEWLSRKQLNPDRTGFIVSDGPDPYYTAIGAEQNVPDFAKWQKKFGFGSVLKKTIDFGLFEYDITVDNMYRIAVKYFNKLDLGIGRDMHCSRFGDSSLFDDPKGVACYVTNYGALPLSAGVTPELESTTLQDMHDFNKRGDTVAMTYDPNKREGFRVEFYIFATALKNNQGQTIPDSQAILKTSIKLDSEAPSSGEDLGKASPGLCLSCHGGAFNTVSENGIEKLKVKGASFLPFDPSLFGYEENGEIQQNVQEDNFKLINAYVLGTNPTVAIKSLIEGLYTGVNQTDTSNGIYSNGSRSDANANYIPAGWNEGEYKVAQKYCLMCHMALSDNNPLNFSNNPQGFSSNLQGVCNSKAMPHAEVPYNHFWRSGIGYANCPQQSPQGVWTEWLNRDDPGATGDYETLNSFLKEGETICDTPTAIECRTRDKRLTPDETGEVYSCEPTTGGACKNSEQLDDGSCLDYEVRFRCFETRASTWTPWLNRDTPNATGDYETLRSFKDEGENICDTPTAIECRTRDKRRTPEETGEVYSCEPRTGGACKNAAQSDRQCLDYEVRFECPTN